MLDMLLADKGPAMANVWSNPVSCLYEDNPTSEEPLCELWCEVQLYAGNVCYRNIPTTTTTTTTTTTGKSGPH
jgi:hypothetical protein